MAELDISAPEAVESVHEEKKRGVGRFILFGAVFFIIVIIALLLFSEKPPETPLPISFTTSIYTVPKVASNPFQIPGGYKLMSVSDEIIFLWDGFGFTQANGKQLIFEKANVDYYVYMSKGTPAGWGKLVSFGNLTLEEELSRRAYSSPLLFDDEQVVFIFWWHNDTIIAVNATDRTGIVDDLSRKLVGIYPPTDPLV